MAYDEKLADRVRRLLSGRRQVVEKKLFGGLGFMYRGNMMCGVLGPDLVVRLGAGGASEALADRHARPFDYTGKVLKTMVYLAPEGVRGRSLEAWVVRGEAFARTLPEKPKKPKNPGKLPGGARKRVKSP